MWLVKRISDGKTFPDFQERADGNMLLKNAIRGGFAPPEDLYPLEVDKSLWEAERDAWEVIAKSEAEAQETVRQEMLRSIYAKLRGLGFTKDEILLLADIGLSDESSLR